MELAFEDALDLFRGWRDDTSQVAFFLDGTEALVKIRGVVTQVLADEMSSPTMPPGSDSD